MVQVRYTLRSNSVSGVVPNTSSLNTAELGINLADGILYSTNGNAVFAIGANLVNQKVSNSITVGGVTQNSEIIGGTIYVSNAVVVNGFVINTSALSGVLVQVNSDWNANTGVAQILNKPTLASVATSGSYNDLIDTPNTSVAQVNSDWDASNGVAQILNKPSLATVATSGVYSDLTGKPTIPPDCSNANNITSGIISRARLQALTVQTINTSSSTVSINIAAGEYIILNLLNSLTTVTITGWVNNYFEKCVLEVRQGNSYTMSGWTGKWANSTPPTITTGSGSIDRIMASSADGGNTVLWDVINQKYA